MKRKNMDPRNKGNIEMNKMTESNTLSILNTFSKYLY